MTVVIIFLIVFAVATMGISASGPDVHGEEERLRVMAGGGGEPQPHTDEGKTARRVEMGHVLTTIIAQLRSGGNLRAQLEALAGRKFALPGLTQKYVEEALSPGDHASTPQMARLSSRVMMCAALSESLGSRLTQSLSVVHSLYLQESRFEDLRTRAFSLPRATVKLLSGLPVVTLCGGEVLGAHPFIFLFHSAAGVACLIVGLFFFCAGLVWVRRLMVTFDGR
jgi:tight adherence protein B